MAAVGEAIEERGLQLDKQAESRIAASQNVPDASCRCLSHFFSEIFALFGLRFGWLQMTSDARSLQIAQRVRGHLRLRVPIGAEHQ
jgi:hypothetical protein